MTLPTISVKNFGPIRKGRVELRPLTVFTGQSDTGKSWFAALIYSLYTTVTTKSSGWHNEAILDSLREEQENLNFPENIENWLTALREKEDIQFSSSEHKILNDCANLMNLNLVFDVESSVGAESANELTRWHSNAETTIDVTTRDRHYKNIDFINCVIRGNRFETGTLLPERIKFKNNTILRRYVERIMNHNSKREEEVLQNHMLNLVLRDIYRQRMGAIGSVYLPAGRVGLTDSFNLLASSIIGEYSNKFRFQEIRQPFSKILSDYIASISNIRTRELKYRKKPIMESADRIEKNLLKGEVVVRANRAGMPFLFFKRFGVDEEIPLRMTSSTVTQLAPLVLFLRYTVNINNIIILEEPEVHLHPEKQVILVDELVRLVNDGFKIVITTHSEWISDAIRNAIMSKRRDENNKLNENDVGVWHFSQRNLNAGTIIKKEKWDQEYGGFHTGFENAADNLHNEWADANSD